jgi:hypothetical protein
MRGQRTTQKTRTKHYGYWENSKSEQNKKSRSDYGSYLNSLTCKASISWNPSRTTQKPEQNIMGIGKTQNQNRTKNQDQITVVTSIH